MNEHQSLERSLFDWTGWDDNGPMSAQFYNVVLKVPIGEFPIGTKFSCAFIDGESGTLELWEDQDGVKHFSYELGLIVGAQILSA